MRKLTVIYRKHFMVCLLIAILLPPASAFAEEWEYRWMPYLWTAGIDAELGPPGQTTFADVSFRDYVEFIDAGAALAFEARSDQ